LRAIVPLDVASPTLSDKAWISLIPQPATGFLGED